MTNETVVYSNEMNDIQLKNFTSKELDIFIELCAKVKEKGTKDIEFDFAYLKNLINWKDNTSGSFSKTLESMYKKLLMLNCKVEIAEGITEYFVLFNKFRADLNTQKVYIRVNEDFAFLLNKIGNYFTKFELQEFIEFKSKYTKEFFRRMKQYTAGFWEVNLDDFTKILDVPNWYKMSEIDKWVLKPILKELGDKYKLKVIKKYKQKSRRGRPSVVGFRFEYSVINKKTEDKEDTTDSDIELLGEFNNIHLSKENYITLLYELNGDEKKLKYLIECASESKKSGKYKSQTDFSRVYCLINNYNDKNNLKKYKIKTPEYIKKEIRELNDKQTKKKEITEEDKQAHQELLKLLEKN